MKRINNFFSSFFCIFLIMTACGSSERREKEFEIRAKKVGEVILRQTSACLAQSKAYVAVWEYARVTGTDFKTAAGQVLQGDPEAVKIQFNEMKIKIENLLDGFKNPPEKYLKTYEKLQELYDIYTGIHSLALNPSDTQENHESSQADLYDKFMDTAEELESTFEVQTLLKG